LLYGNIQDLAEERFPGCSYQDRKPKAAQDGQSFEQKQIVLRRLAEADTRKQDDDRKKEQTPPAVMHESSPMLAFSHS